MADMANNVILAFNPALRSFTRAIDVKTISGITLGGAFECGLAGSPGTDPLNDTLFVTGHIGSSATYEVFRISASNGTIISRFAGDVWDSGLAVVGNELYLGSEAATNNQLRVYSLTGQFLRNVALSSTTFFFDTYGLGSDGVPGLVPTSFRYRDAAVGLDGNLYALDVNGIDVGVFNPSTLAVVRFFQLDAAVRAITVAADGTIYGGKDSGDVIEFNPLGKLVRQVPLGIGVINDIDLNNSGTILLSNIVGEFAVTNRTLAPPVVVSTSIVADAFISFGESAVFSTADLLVTITNPDPTEVSVPLTVIIPAGQSFIDIPLDAVDDFIRDGAQQVILSVSSQGYFGSSQTVVVLDAEGVQVDVIADSISEAAGAGATQVKVSRSDVDGPYDYLSTQEFSNSSVYDVTDTGTIYAPIVIPKQVSRISDLDVTVNFQHQWLGDLDVFLISPSGTRVELFTDLVSNGNQLTGTILDDQGNQSINSGSAPYTGRFMPEGTLSQFNMESPTGAWLLEVSDDNTSDVGKLLGWSMTMQTEGLSAVTVVLQTSVVNKAQFQGSDTKTVVIPANQSEVLVNLDAVDNTILDGNTNVTISATSTSVTSFSLDADNVVVTDYELLTFTVSKTSVSEAAGPGALTGTVKRLNTDLGSPYTVSLTSSNTGKLTVPATVSIPASQMSVTFPIDAIDNTFVDGNTLVTLTATATGYANTPVVQVNVLDLEPVLNLTTLTPTVVENGGSLNVTVTRLDQTPAALALPQIVNLTSGAGLSVPATVTIPANSIQTTFSVGITDNAKLEGTRSVNIHATGALMQPGDLVIAISDYETLTVTVDRSSFLENSGIKAAIGTVRRSNLENLGQALVVALASSDTTELTVPATVTIPAGQASATFFITAVNDPDLDGPQNVAITATSTGYVNGTVGVTVLDHEPPVITGPAATTVAPRPQVTWTKIAGALRYDVWVSNLSSGVSQVLRDVNVPQPGLSITVVTYTPPENLGIGRYRVWVRAIDSLEVAGFWSAGRDFTINTAPTITFPAANAVIADSKFPTITWTAVTDAAKYELWVNNLTTGQIRVINRTGTAALNTTSYVSTEGLGSGTYRIWVRGKNNSGEFGLWSAPVTHTVLAPPVITEPTSGGTFDRTPTFSWTAIAGATNYDVWVGNVKTNAIVFRNKFVTKTSFTATSDMANGEYRVWVRAQSGNSFSAWSLAKTFSVGLPPKITSATAVGPQNAAPKITWTSISETETYELWVNNAAGVRVIYFTSLTNTTFTSATNLQSGTYRIWVRAVSKMGETTGWSSPVDLTIASSEFSQPSPQTAQTIVLASLIFDNGQLTPDGSPVELSVPTETPSDVPLEHYSVVAVSPQTDLVETPVRFEAPVAAAAAECDEVMAGWQSTEWWAETSQRQDRREFDTTAALAAGLGFFVRTGKTSDNRKKRNLN